MPALRRLSPLRTPELYLAVVCLVLALACVDAMRPPRSQITARLYVVAVGVYQRWGSPVTSRFVACRFRPTCSEYSREAVERFGVVRGLALTVSRLARCRTNVPAGTADPVPQAR